MSTPPIAANLRHAARNHQTVTIGGGHFTPPELLQAAEMVEAAARHRFMVEAANADAQIRDKLIAMGWTPPPQAAAVVLQQRQQAIDHLHALLNTQRTATQALEAEWAARNWLDSIGSEPR